MREEIKQEWETFVYGLLIGSAIFLGMIGIFMLISCGAKL